MRNWIIYSLEDVCSRITDGSHWSPKSIPAGIPMASVKNMTNFGIDIDSCRNISEEDYGKLVRNDCRPLRNDVLIAKDGSYLKHCFVWKREIEIAVLSSIAILRPQLGMIEPNFLAKYLLNPATKKALQGYVSGVAIPRIILKDFRRFPILLPPLPTQRKIASILSSYDDLIENNLRCIKILEEMAQSLYREWFVKFRFPGHEKVKFVDSPLGKVPVGWNSVSLEGICSRITDGSHSSPKSTEDGYPMASVKDMTNWSVNISSCRKISSEDFDFLKKTDCIMKKNDILIAKDGSYLKHCFPVEKDLDVALLSSIALLRPENIEPLLLAFILRDPYTKDRLKGYVSGAALPRIILKEFRKFLVVLPDEVTQQKWTELSLPMVQLCWRLLESNENLRQTRDLLLPKLISGKLDVSDIDIKIPEETA